MAKTVLMKHPQTGLTVKGRYGFSWTYLFFGFWVPLLRGEVAIAFLHFLFTAITCGLWHLIGAFVYNKQFMTRLLEKGYIFADSDQRNAAARSKLGIIQPAAQPI